LRIDIEWFVEEVVQGPDRQTPQPDPCKSASSQPHRLQSDVAGIVPSIHRKMLHQRAAGSSYDDP